MSQTVEAPRLDKWLWFARFAKTRTLAQSLCASGHVKVNGISVRRGHQKVKIGDTIEMVLGTVRRTVTVVAFGERRGPAPEAQALYDEPTPPDRLKPYEDRPVAKRPPGSGRPSKRERRQMEAMIHGFQD
jgi:ribosome-associated heat shock protein Hsp15